MSRGPIGWESMGMSVSPDLRAVLATGEPVELEYVRVSLEAQILTVTINRPQVRNALHPPACAELARVLDFCEAAATVRAAIVTGAGEEAFCAGFDLKYAEQHPELYGDPLFGSELVRRTDRRKPTIAAVNGLALGFGFELALACDLIIAAEQASFGLPEVRVGLAAMAGGVVRLTREIGTKRALGMILAARRVSAREGWVLGFVNEVCSDSALAGALRWATDIVKGAPIAIAASKEIAYRQAGLPNLAAALDPRSYPEALQVLNSEDAQEGRRAFLEKRLPAWRGC